MVQQLVHALPESEVISPEVSTDDREALLHHIEILRSTLGPDIQILDGDEIDERTGGSTAVKLIPLHLKLGATVIAVVGQAYGSNVIEVLTRPLLDPFDLPSIKGMVEEATESSVQCTELHSTERSKTAFERVLESMNRAEEDIPKETVPRVLSSLTNATVIKDNCLLLPLEANGIDATVASPSFPLVILIHKQSSEGLRLDLFYTADSSGSVLSTITGFLSVLATKVQQQIINAEEHELARLHERTDFDLEIDLIQEPILPPTSEAKKIKDALITSEQPVAHHSSVQSQSLTAEQYEEIVERLRAAGSLL